MGNTSTPGIYPSSEEDLKAYVSMIDQIKVSNPENIAISCFSKLEFAKFRIERQKDLMKCLASGIVNPQSIIGCYANQPTDYDTFSSFFTEVIQRYHKLDLSLKTQINNWSLDGMSDDDLPTSGILDLREFGFAPVSINLRIARNMFKATLPAAMTRDERVQMELQMGVIFDALISKQDFGGRYVSLTPGHEKFISQNEYAKLVKAHIMFNDLSADPFLSAAGVACDWPYGRGCYISEDNLFLIWVGGEDHLTMICTQKGTIISEVFNKVHKAMNFIESQIEGGFAKSQKFGMVTSCPSKIGTGMQVSVQLALPKLTMDGTVVAANSVANKFSLSVKGLGGERSVGLDGMVEIYPITHFCISEAQILTSLYFGLKALKEEEDASNPTLEQLVLRTLEIAEQYPGNIMASCLDIGFLNILNSDQQARFMKCCMPGILNPNSEMGCYANYSTDYDEFELFFRGALEKYHKVNLSKQSQKHDWVLKRDKFDLSVLGLPPLSIRVRVTRNLKKFPLPASMTKQQRMDLEVEMCAVFDKLKTMNKVGGEYYSITPWHLNAMKEELYDEFVNEHLMFENMLADTNLTCAGIASDWPYGRGCYISSNRQFIIWVGKQDHLSIMWMKKGTNLGEVFDLLKSALEVVEGLIEGGFAKSPKFGFITSCPTNIGTGMRASVHMNFPKLTKDGTDSNIKVIAKQKGLSVRGLFGENTPIGAEGTVDISPGARFCTTEAQILTALYEGIQELKTAEDRAV